MSNFLSKIIENLSKNSSIFTSHLNARRSLSVNISEEQLKRFIISEGLSSELKEIDEKFSEAEKKTKELERLKEEIDWKNKNTERELRVKYQDSIESVKKALELENDEKIRHVYKTELLLASEKEKNVYLTKELERERNRSDESLKATNSAIVEAFKNPTVVNVTK
jgi:hypothetical protein